MHASAAEAGRRAACPSDPGRALAGFPVPPRRPSPSARGAVLLAAGSGEGAGGFSWPVQMDFPLLLRIAQRQFPSSPASEAVYLFLPFLFFCP